MRRRPVCLVCLAMMLVMCLADLAGFPLIHGNPLPEQVQVWIQEHPDAVICGEVQRCQDTEFSFSVYLKQVFLTNQSEKFPIENVRMFMKTKEDLPAGTVVYASGKLERVEAPRNPGEFDSQQYYACQHIYYFLRDGVIEKKSRTWSGYQQWLLDFKKRLCGILQKAAGESAPVFEAMLLGEKSDLDSELKLRYQMTGMIHILAISGLHISILGMGLFNLLKRIGLGNTGAGLISLTVMIQYGMLTGGSVSAMRAVCMFLLSVGAKIAGRTYDLLTSVSLSAVLMLLDSPAYLYSSSFLLSFGAVAGLGALSPCLIEFAGTRRKLIRGALSSFSVQLVTLPVMLTFFGEVSVAGIFLNLFILPTVGGVLLSGLCCCILGMFHTEAAVMAALPGRGLLLFYEKCCILAGKLPFCTWVGGKPEIWQIVIYYICLFLGAAAVRRIPKKRVSATILIGVLVSGIFFLSLRDRSVLRITCLDVGQGDGIVIEMPGGGAFLMDCGSSSRKNTGQYQLLPYLKNRGIGVLEGVMISHTDKDHISGIREILEFMEKGLTSVKVKSLILPASLGDAPGDIPELAKRAEVPCILAKEGDKLKTGSVEMKFLAPEENAAGKDANEEGLVMELIYGSFRALFTGDIGMDTEYRLLEKDLVEPVDFLKVAHHGSRYSTSWKFLDKARPCLAVISCSDTNTYGHPSPETVERLEDSGVKIAYTMKSGAVTIYTDGAAVQAEGYVPLSGNT